MNGSVTTPGMKLVTAFGLMHFKDMSAVREVDQKMASTTRPG
ncbi:MAG: hypothetical protein R3C24_02565 [Cyanobacteriota/Melainabacteria group bacterium]